MGTMETPVLQLYNFKSIKEGSVKIKPVTIILGPPDSGKSNLLEGLAMFSMLAYGGNVYSYLRTFDLRALFYNFNPSFSPSVSLMIPEKNVELKISISPESQGRGIEFTYSTRDKMLLKFVIADGIFYPVMPQPIDEYLSLLRIRFYRFSYPYLPFYQPIGYFPDLTSFLSSDYVVKGFLMKNNKRLYDEILSNVLLPPHGENLFFLLRKEDYYEFAKSVIKDLGYDDLIILQYRGEKWFLMRNLKPPIIYPLELASYGFINYIYVSLAIESNIPNEIPKIIPDIIAFEEPEAHSFPFLAWELAKDIAYSSSEDKRIVLTTHNPSIVSALLEKVRPENLAVYWLCRDQKTFASKIIEVKEDILDKARGLGLSSIEELRNIVKCE